MSLNLPHDEEHKTAELVIRFDSPAGSLDAIVQDIELALLFISSNIQISMNDYQFKE